MFPEGSYNLQLQGMQKRLITRRDPAHENFIHHFRKVEGTDFYLPGWTGIYRCFSKIAIEKFRYFQGEYFYLFQNLSSYQENKT